VIGGLSFEKNINFKKKIFFFSVKVFILFIFKKFVNLSPLINNFDFFFVFKKGMLLKKHKKCTPRESLQKKIGYMRVTLII
jgi:hypothetical protein